MRNKAVTAIICDEIAHFLYIIIRDINKKIFLLFIFYKVQKIAILIKSRFCVGIRQNHLFFMFFLQHAKK